MRRPTAAPTRSRSCANRATASPCSASRVTEAGLLDASDLDAIDSEAEAQIDGAVAKAKVAPPPTAADLLTDVYVSY